MNIMVDKALLEDARKATGEKTYSATIQRGLEKLVQKQRFYEALAEWEKLADEGPMFIDGYLDMIRPGAAEAIKEWEAQRQKKVSADTKRLPPKKKKRA